MDHRAYIDNKQKYSQSHSKINEHLLSSCLFERNIFFGNPSSKGSYSDDEIYTYKIYDQGVEHKDNKSG